MATPTNNTVTTAQQPRIVDLGPLLIAGMHEPMTMESESTIPLLWQKFAPFIGKIPHQVDGVGYGLCMQEDSKREDFYYMAGCAVWDFGELPPELTALVLPSQRYAVFKHHQSVTQIRATIDWIFDQWLPASDYQLMQRQNNSLHLFERYGESFNAQLGTGDIEIWVPVIRKN